MGLFQSRPEEPQDWGGLPAEPYNPEFDTARLDDTGALPSALGDGTTASVTISFSMDALTQSAAAEPAPGSAADDA